MILITIKFGELFPWISSRVINNAEKLYQAFEKVFNQVSKNLEVRLKKTSALPRFYATPWCLDILMKYSPSCFIDIQYYFNSRS